ncbi:MAG: fatty acid desaturase [Leptospiraceae bacterium]|nr:fatty acid desaturase [Leptospiraceae bacterium]MDW7976050.1 fatty acid desaturase [Leptospiraceae bacterium]
MGKDTLNNKFFYINHLLILVYIIGLNFVYFISPIFLKHTEIFLWIPLLGIFSNPHWVLIHEAIHGVLFKNKSLNDFWGRVLSIYFGSPFRILQGGHLLHHAYNRTKAEVTDIYNPKETSKAVAIIRYYYWLLGGLYITELLVNFIALLPKSVFEKLKIYMKNRSIHKYNYASFILLNWKETKMDGIINILFYSIIFYLYGEFWYVFVGFLLVRGFMISMMDNVFHYGTEPNQISFGYNLKTLRLLEIYLLNANYHGFHHLKPKIPWYLLKTEWLKTNSNYHGNFAKQYFSQLKGPIPTPNL